MPNRLLAAVTTAAVITLGLLGLTVEPAVAHAELVASDPAAGARLDARPDKVTLRFGEKIAARTALARVVVTADGAETSYDPVAQVNGSRVVVPLEDVTSYGRYDVTYRVVSADGHPVEDTLRFRVVKPAASDDNADGSGDDDQAGAGDDGAGDGSGDGGSGAEGQDGDATPTATDTPTATGTGTLTPAPTTTAPGSGTAGADDVSPPFPLLGGGLFLLLAAGAAVAIAARRRSS